MCVYVCAVCYSLAVGKEMQVVLGPQPADDRENERMRIAGLRCREAAARTTLASRRRNACFMKKIVRHATERKRGLASQTGGGDSIHFRSDEQKMWNDAGRSIWLTVCRRTISGKIYLRQLRGGRALARAAKDNAAQRRSCSGSSLTPAEARYCSRMLTREPPQAATREYIII